MSLPAILLAALTGYLFGSISFARLLVRLLAPDKKVGQTQIIVGETDMRFTSDTVSASTVRFLLGPRYGFLVAVLDVLKGFLPGLLFRLWLPDSPAYLVTAGMATVGHNWPVYYGFKGGRGISPILGGMLVMDWLGVLVANTVATILGLGLHRAIIYMAGGILLMIPWTLWRFGPSAELAYVLIMNLIFWPAMIPELRQYLTIVRSGQGRAFDRATRIRVIHADGTETTDEVTSVNVLDGLRKRLGGRQENAG